MLKIIFLKIIAITILILNGLLNIETTVFFFTVLDTLENLLSSFKYNIKGVFFRWI